MMSAAAMCALLAAALVAAHALLEEHQGQPYMDEVFHIPQAQAYCQGRWRHWDAMITTPPGPCVLRLRREGEGRRAVGSGREGG